MFFKETEYEGWTNWETWNTYVMLDNEQEHHNAVRKIVADGGNPKDIENYAIPTVIAWTNNNSLESAQEWNDLPEDERSDPHYDSLSDGARDLVDKFIGPPDLGDINAADNMVDPDLVNWQEIHTRIAQDVWEDETYDTPDQFNDEANPYLQEFVPDNPDDIKFASIHQSLAGTDVPLYDTWTGLRLPWAKTANVEGAGPYLRRILKQPGKKLMTDEGQQFLQYLASLGEDVDPLTPWLAAQYKKGNIGFRSDLEDVFSGKSLVRLDQGDGKDILDREFIEQMAQWYNATDHPTRQGMNIQEMDLYEVVRATQSHQAALQRQQELDEAKQQAIKSGADIVHTFDNGYTVKELDPDDLWSEGKLLGHCIGGAGYIDSLRRGDIEVFSLRDPEGLPHATWHYNRNGELEELQGKSGEPSGEYYDMFKEWAEFNDRPYETNRGLEYYNLGDIEDWWTFWQVYSGSGDGAYGVALEMANEELHEEAEIDWGPVRVNRVVDDLLSHVGFGVDLDPVRDVFESVVSADMLGEFIEAFDDAVQTGDLDKNDPLLVPFKNYIEDFTDPMTGELVTNGDGSYDPYTRKMHNPKTRHPDDPEYLRTPREKYEKENLMPLFTEQQDWHSRLVDMRGAYHDHPTWMNPDDFVYQVGQGDPRIVPWWDENGTQDPNNNISWSDQGLYKDLVKEKGKTILQEPWLGPASPYFNRYEPELRDRFGQ